MKRLATAAVALALCWICASAAEAAPCTARPIAAGYGADGPYAVQTARLSNPGDPRDEMTVYLPQGAAYPRPVVFFAHGFGPGRSTTYADFIDHIVSKGSIVVFSTFPMRGVSVAQRYDSLWKGFAAAAQRFGSKMDLSRVAFVGHSFGGGAVPDMAYKGLMENGWGKNGAFMMELAPWYLYGITNARVATLPTDAIQFVEVYDRDTVNDHRIAIHLYDASRASQRYYVLVQSNSACGFTADHSTPGSNTSLVQKEYAVFRPFDMLADLAFNGTGAARQALGDLGEPGPGYRPLRRLTAPTPDQPESNYRWPWGSPLNPQR